MKLAVIFPGIGYHSDKPLLYYSKKAAREYGYEIKEISYSDLPHVTAGDRKMMAAAYEKAAEQAQDQLENTDLSEYEDVLFISKSLGTVIASGYAYEHDHDKVRHLCFTPVEDTFRTLKCGSGLIFHGLADPWCESSKVFENMKDLNAEYRLYTFENANHSLETGDFTRDIEIISEIFSAVKNELSCDRNI